ncbi:DUF4347 domain-containing protein [Achromobacter mucicolens]|uniref:DUF4347 domain-containing protein n=1 Tax=Achromobacter mucicolens TaxID=1389922 RepID=UPI00397637CE
MKKVKQWLAGSLNGANRPRPAVAASPLLMALEPRIVYDASVAALSAQPHQADPAPEIHRAGEPQADAPSQANATPPAVSAGQPRASDTPPPAAAQAQSAGRQTAQDGTQTADRQQQDQQAAADGIAVSNLQSQVVFIDPSVEKYQTLIDGLAPGTQYVVLDARSDGFAQIAQYLQSHPGVDAISLISHGSNGAIQAGSTWLTASSLAAHSADLARIGAAMNPGGDFLIYGCDIAQQADGQALVRQIADLSHLDVAASTDATGAATRGGDWTLEYHAGDVQATLNASPIALAQYGGLLAVTTETYDTAASNNFSAVGQSQFTLNGITYTFDRATNSFAYNDSNSPNGPTDITDGPTDGVLMLNADGASVMRSVTISLANGHTFSLQGFDLSSFNGDLYIQANYKDGSHSALIQLATATVGGFVGTVSNQNQLGSAFDNIVSFSLIDQNDTGAFEPSLDNLAYIEVGAFVTTSPGNAAWSSANNGVGGTAVAIDPGLTLSGTSTAISATVRITNFVVGDQLGFTAQNGISGSYNASVGELRLTGTASLAQWQAALRSVTFSSTMASPSLSDTTRSIAFSFSDGQNDSDVATRNITITETPQTPLVSDGSPANTNYVAGSAGIVVNSTISVSDADSLKLPAGTVTISAGYIAGDTLSFNNSSVSLYGDIIGSYDSATRTLSLTSVSDNATVAQWQNALRAVTFSAGASTSAGLRDITFSVRDSASTSALLHHSVQVETPLAVVPGAGSAAFTSGDNTISTPVAVDAGLTLSGGNSATLASATVAITGNFQVNHDELVFIGNPATSGDISGVYDSGTGVLTLTSAGGASLAQWQTALRSIRFTNDLVVPSSATRTVSFQISDGTQTSAVAARSVTVTATDQTPLLGNSGNTAHFVSGDNSASTPIVVNSAITVSDADGGPLQQAVVTISGNYQPTDELRYINNNAALYGNIFATYVNGVLTLTSSGRTATLAQWQNALQAITFTSTAVVPSTATRTVNFSVSDGTKISAAAQTAITVTASTQTPILSGSAGSVTFTQGDNAPGSAIVIDAGIMVSDLDSATLTQANVVIASGYDSNGDTLLFTNDGATMGNITGSYSSGVLVLTSSNGSATLAQWQSALRSIRFTDIAAVPSTTQRTINFVITDGFKVSASIQRMIDVQRVDQSPVLTNSGGSSTFTSADNAPSTPVVIDASLTLSDPDTPTMVSATVRITGNYQMGEDVLAMGSGSFGDIQATFDAATGTLTLTSAGGSTTAQWQAALRSVTYAATSAVPQTFNRTISFSVNDGAKSSGISDKAIIVIATHQTPVLGSSGDSVTYLPGQSGKIIDSGLTLTDRNVAGASLVALTLEARITSGLQQGDILNFDLPLSTLTNGMTVTYDAAVGKLTIASTGGTLAQWQSLLANIHFSAAASAPLGARTVEFTISDGVKTSAPLSYTVDVISSAPALSSPSTGPVSFVAGDNTSSSPVVIDGGLLLASPLGNVVDSAVVAITGNLHSAEDVLSFVNNGLTMGDITGSYNVLTGVLTLNSASGTATLAQWQAALRSITYADTRVSPNTATRTISFSVNAGPQFSNVLTRAITVTATDQTPLISSGSTGAASFVAGDNTASTPVTVDSGIALSDLDNATLASATVQIGAGFHAGQDVLAFANDGVTMGNIVAAYDAVNGTLTLTSAGGTATLAQWQAALRAVTYRNTAVTPDTVTRTIGFAVSDGIKSSTALTRDVTVTATDQTPVISSGSTGSVSFVSGDNTVSTPVTVDGGIALSDLDNATLASATVQIGAGFHAGQDVLGFTNDGLTMGNIAATYDAAHGTLTLNSAGGTATLAQWQAALRAVTYLNTAITPDTANRSIGFAVSDGIKSSTALTRDVTVTATDQTPVISSGSTGSVSFVSGDNTVSTPVTVDGGIALSDLDNATLASATVQIGAGFHAGQDVLGFANDGLTMGNIAATYDAAHGTLMLNSAGGTATLAQWQAALRAVTYLNTAITPDTANRSIGFAVSDGAKASAIHTRDVTVTATGQTPVISSGSTGATPFISGDNMASTPVAIDTGIALSDADNATLASATVQIGAGFVASEDLLGFNNDGLTMGNIAATYDAAHGTLTLTSAGGTATLAQWQAALRAVTYTNTAITPDAATRSIGIAVNDGAQASAVFSRDVAITAVRQTPHLSDDGASPVYTASQDASPVAVGTGITLTDRNATPPTTATVSFSGTFDPQRDVLGFAATAQTGDIVASYDPASGVLTLRSVNGAATVAQWQAALAAVTYRDSQAESTDGTRTLLFTVANGDKTSAALQRTLHIEGVPASSQVGVPILPQPQQNVDTALRDDNSETSERYLNPAQSPAIETRVFELPTGRVGDASTPFYTLVAQEGRNPGMAPSPVGVPKIERVAGDFRYIPPELDFTSRVQALPSVDIPQRYVAGVAFSVVVKMPFVMDAQAMRADLHSITTARLPGGAPLPAWLHYDADSGELTGTPPAGVDQLRIVLQAGGFSREFVLHFEARDNQPAAPVRPGASEPRAALPAAKDSLAAQFANAMAALHISHNDAAPSAAPHTATEHRS